MNQILRCDWLLERARWSYVARSGLPAFSRKKNFPEGHIINPLLAKLVRSRWLEIGLVLFWRVHGPRFRLGPLTRNNRTWPMSSHLDRTSLVNNLHTIYPCPTQSMRHTRGAWWEYTTVLLSSDWLYFCGTV